MQENWIGKSQGLQFCFRWSAKRRDRRNCDIEVFTTRPDTIFGASFVAISPGHPIAEGLAATDPKVAAFIDQCRKGGTTAAEIETAEKLGFDTGLEVVHPLDAEAQAAGLDRQFRADGLWHRGAVRRPRPRRPRL